MSLHTHMRARAHTHAHTPKGVVRGGAFGTPLPPLMGVPRSEWKLQTWNVCCLSTEAIFHVCNIPREASFTHRGGVAEDPPHTTPFDVCVCVCVCVST